MNAKIRMFVFLAVTAFLAGGSLTYGASLQALLSHSLAQQTASFNRPGKAPQSGGLDFFEVRRSLRNRCRIAFDNAPMTMTDRIKPPLMTTSGLITDPAILNALIVDPGSLFHPPA
jgi:hypothetical protein